MKDSNLGMFMMQFGAVAIEVANGNEKPLEEFMKQTNLSEDEIGMVMGGMALMSAAHAKGLITVETMGKIMLTLKVADCLVTK